MKIFIWMLIIGVFIIGSAYPEPTRGQNGNYIFTITLTSKEYDAMSVTVENPEQWINDAVHSKANACIERIKLDMTKIIQPSEADFKAKVKVLQAEKLKREKEIR